MIMSDNASSVIIINPLSLAAAWWVGASVVYVIMVINITHRYIVIE